jgi:CRISPR-associated Csx2 family protein
MSRKIFLSFLGTNNYVPCNYYVESDATQKVENVKYIQEAILQMACVDFCDTDAAYIFLTDAAKKQNWLNDGQFNIDTKAYDLSNTGLQCRLEELTVFKGIKHAVDIPEGFSTNEIMQIFQIVFDLIQDDDEIYLDITHAFRSLPMLGLVLMNYAKTLKNVTLKTIHYGAFEKLGPATQVIKMPSEIRNAPILNLLPLANLMDWSTSAQNFIKYGITNDLTTLANQYKVQAIQANNIEKQSMDLISEIAKSFTAIAINFKTNRGYEIIEGIEFERANERIEAFKKNINLMPQLHPILDKLKFKISEFKKDGKLNWLHAVQWCLQHNMLQEGITQLQEGLITYICRDEGLNYKTEVDRKKIADALHSTANLLRENKNTIDNAASEKNKFEKLAAIFAGLSTIRNNINHGGYNPQAGDTKILKADEFKKKLESNYNAIKTIVCS